MQVPDNNPNEIQLNLILADYAKVSDGKLDLLGGGWSSCVGPHVGPCAVVMLAKVPSSWSGQQIEVKLELFDEDGKPVNNAPKAAIKVVPQGGLRPGEPLDLPFAMGVQPFMVIPNRRYEWRATVNGETSSSWQASFFVGDGAPPAGTLRPAS